MEPQHHRAGKLKQQNKPHKSQGKSKRESKKYLSAPSSSAAGRARAASQQSATSTASSRNRAARKQKSADMRKQKRSALIMKKRLGGGLAAPRVVAIVSLSSTTEEPVANFSRSVCTNAVKHNLMEETQCFADKSRLTFIDTTEERDPIKVLDACKVADIVAFVITLVAPNNSEEIEIRSSVSGGLAMVLSSSIDERGRDLLTVIKAQGMPTPVALIEGLTKVPMKHRTAARRNLATFFQSELGGGNDLRVLDLSTQMDEYTDCGKALVRALTEIAIKPITWRSERSYLLGVERSMTVPGKIQSVRGHLRGRPMSVHQLVHVPGQGTFRLARISFPKDPSAPPNHGERMQPDDIIARPELLPSLEEEAEPDVMGGEQTWPTREELGDDDDMEEEGDDALIKMPTSTAAKGNSKRKSIQVDGGDDVSMSGGDNDDARSRASTKKTSEDPSKEFLKAWGVDVENDDEFDWGGVPLNKPPKSKAERAKMDADFPDEMDTPGDVPARDRFVKYRGLKSFRTSPWHPTESLPREYAYIHQLKNFRQAQKLVLQQSEDVEKEWVRTGTLPEDYVEPGTFVELWFEEQGFECVNGDTGSLDPLVVGALLPHEQRLSLLNCLIQPKETSEPVESRDDLELHVGLWRRPVRPLFSEHNLNSDKHKMERFAEPHRWTVCSSYAPITFGTNIPAMLFRPSTGELVGTGSVLDVNPNRIVLKKVVLTGVPFRIKKRWAVVRKMFYNPEDVTWFRPVELYTKYGASGRILESVGTHGSMKCQFDRVITQQDTVCMALYKRVFPKRASGTFKDLGDEPDEEDQSDLENGRDGDDDDESL